MEGKGKGVSKRKREAKQKVYKGAQLNEIGL